MYVGTETLSLSVSLSLSLSHHLPSSLTRAHKLFVKLFIKRYIKVFFMRTFCQYNTTTRAMKSWLFVLRKRSHPENIDAFRWFANILAHNNLFRICSSSNFKLQVCPKWEFFLPACSISMRNETFVEVTETVLPLAFSNN